MGLIDTLKTYVDQDPLSEDKKDLFNKFLQKGFPTLKDEEWKYTSLKKIINYNYIIPKKSDTISEDDIQKHSLGLKNKCIISNGKILMSPEIKGVKISGFSDFKCRNNEPISSLNAALAKNGFTISVDKNTIVRDPIEILFFNTSENGFYQYRNQINVGENSEVCFVEKIQDLNFSTNLTNCFTQINCEKNSKTEYNKIQNNHRESRLIDRVNVFQKKDSTCNINTLIFGGGFIRNNLDFEQNGTNCESNMNGISLLDGTQIADNHTFVDHKNPNCRSNEMYKGIYLDHSKGVFNGKIMVRKDAQKIDAFQANNNLLLSENSTIDSKPQLEIYADDVKCSHGCTIGQLDESAVFYMRSRGVRLEEAKAVLTYAFASEVVENLSIPELRQMSQNILAQKLNVDLDFS